MKPIVKLLYKPNVFKVNPWRRKVDNTTTVTEFARQIQFNKM